MSTSVTERVNGDYEARLRGLWEPYIDVAGIVRATLSGFVALSGMIKNERARGSSDARLDGMEVDLEELLELFEMSDNSSDQLVSWALRADEWLADTFSSFSGLRAQDLRESALSRLSRTREAHDAAMTRKRLEDDANQATRTLERAERASAVFGRNALQTEFTRHARRQLISTNAYRAGSIVAILAAIAIAVPWAADATSAALPEGERWIALARHLAIGVGVGALATYLGRQAAHHRQMFNWARSISIQLQSVPSLVDDFEAEDRSEIMNLLARRALSAPPEKSGESESDISTDRLLELVTAALKKTN